MRLASSSPDGSFVCRVDSKPPQPRSSPGVGAPSPVSERKAATGRLGSNRFATSASVARNQARLMDALGAWRTLPSTTGTSTWSKKGSTLGYLWG